MTQHDPSVRLRHMLDNAREAIAMAAGRKREDLDRDRMLQLSLTHLVEIIGEAASRIEPEIRQQHHTIPWSKITGMRNRLIHGYDTIDLDVLWDTVVHNLPPLADELKKALKEE
jgi:uncharacterized protein with HEPN domain